MVVKNGIFPQNDVNMTDSPERNILRKIFKSTQAT